jgi:hypothetical protein
MPEGALRFRVYHHGARCASVDKAQVHTLHCRIKAVARRNEA